ncbi:amino acid adenylation protein, partial [Arthrobacter deserti]|nr:amino acid adenylation protein [Arthrobacter deserti]
LDPDARWIVDQWTAVLGTPPGSLDADFFAHGGGSLAAAQLVSALRVRYPTMTVARIYAHPRVGALIEAVRQSVPDGGPEARRERIIRRTQRKAQIFQTLMGIPLNVLAGMRWLTYLMIINSTLVQLGIFTGAPAISWWWVLAAWAVFVSPPGRMAIAVAAARLLLRGVGPGNYPRSGKVHLRLWLAEQIADMAGAVSLASAPFVPYYARALGARIGRNVDLHSVPPVTGLLTLGSGASIEPEVDLAGWWIDGDRLHIGAVEVGPGAVVGSRSTLLPGARIGAGASIAPGSAGAGTVRAGMHFSGPLARRAEQAGTGWPDPPAGSSPLWSVFYPAASGLLALIPYLSAAAAIAVAVLLLPDTVAAGGFSAAFWPLLAAVPLAAAAWYLANLLQVVVVVRLLGIGLAPGYHRVRSRPGWQVWATERVLDLARDLLFATYASMFTPLWLRLLGAKVGRNVGASTVLLLPKMTTVGEGAFLADDTMVASYELGGGWMKIAPAKVGKRPFLGNSGMIAGGRKVPKDSLVAVLSATPAKAKSGSSWLGSPPVRLRRTGIEADQALTYAPPARLKVARALWELCRFVPVTVTAAIALGVLALLDRIALSHGYLPAALASGVVMMAAGGVAAGSSVAAKWLLVGRIKAGEHPLWSSFIWRNEVVDT